MLNKIKTSFPFFLIFVVSFSIVSAWTGPTANPPSSNMATPVNIGSTPQTKLGIFGVGEGYSIKAPKYYDYPSTDYYLDPAGNSELYRLYSKEYYDLDDYDFFVNPAGKSVLSSIELGGVERSTWPEEGVSLWTQNGNNIYYNTGNVGIGTASPAQKLHVWGNIRMGDYGGISVTDGNGRINLYSSAFTNTYLQSEAASRITLHTNGVKFYTAPVGTIGNNVVWSEKMSINNNGNVGIGTASPNEKLEVNGAIRAKSGAPSVWNGNHVGYVFGSGGDADGGMFSDADNTLKFATNGATRMTINGGNVGIGTASPSQKLDVVDGNIRASGEIIGTKSSGGYGQFRAIYGNYGLMLRNDGSASYFLLTSSGNQYGAWNSLRPFQIKNASGDVSLGKDALYVKHAGNVGVGDITPSQKLDVAGYVRGASGLCIGNDCRTSWPSGGITSESDTLQSVTSRGNTTNQNIDSSGWMRAWRFYDTTGGYYVDPSNLSEMYSINAVSQVTASKFIDYNNSGFYVDPASTSNINRMLVGYYPTSNNDVATKAYVDAQAGGGAYSLSTEIASGSANSYCNAFGDPNLMTVEASCPAGTVLINCGVKNTDSQRRITDVAALGDDTNPVFWWVDRGTDYNASANTCRFRLYTNNTVYCGKTWTLSAYCLRITQ